MAFLTMAKPSAEGGQSDNTYVNAGAFGGGQSLSNGSVMLNEDGVQDLISEAHENRVDDIYGPNDLTLYDPTPRMQRDTPLMAEQAFPVAPESKGKWLKFVDMMNLSKFGQAGFVNDSDDFNIMSLDGRNFKAGFGTLGIGYRVSYEQQQFDAQNKRRIRHQPLLQQACRTALRQAAEEVAFKGNTSRQIWGVLNNPFLPRAVSDVTFDSTATPTDIQQTIATAESLSYLRTKGTAHRPNAIIGSASALDYMRKREFSSTGDSRRKVLDASLEGTGIKKDYVFESFYMDDVGPANSRALLLYKRDAQCIAWHYPIAVQALPVFRRNGYGLIQLFIARVGSLCTYYPEDTLLLQGV